MTWTKSQLDNLCQIRKGDQLNKLELESSGDYPCINGGIEPSGYTDKWNRVEDTITISEGGNSCGFVNFVRTRFWSGGHCYTLHDLNADLDLRFLYFALKGREKEIMRLRVGSGLPNIQKTALENFEISLPTLPEEQSRISQILSTVDLAIEQTQAFIDKYSRIKRGLMQDLLTCGIDENGNIRNKQLHKFTVKNGIEVPDEWDVVELATLVDPKSPIVYGILMPGYGYEGGIPVIKVKDIKDDEIDLRGLLLTSPQIASQYARSALKPGDLLFTIRGTVGRCAFVPDELDGANITQDTARIRTVGVSARFVRYCFTLPQVKSYVELHTIGQAVKGINLGELRATPIPKPSEKESEMIASLIFDSEQPLTSLRRELKKLQAIKRGLMQDLLSGRKRIELFEAQNLCPIRIS